MNLLLLTRVISLTRDCGDPLDRLTALWTAASRPAKDALPLTRRQRHGMLERTGNQLAHRPQLLRTDAHSQGTIREVTFDCSLSAPLVA